jgi:hypothetical protein
MFVHRVRTMIHLVDARQQVAAKVPRDDAPRIWAGIEAVGRSSIDLNTSKFGQRRARPKAASSARATFAASC